MQIAFFKSRRKQIVLALCTVLLLLFCAVSTFTLTLPRSVHAAPITTLTLHFTCAQAVDYQYGKMCVHTQAGTTLTIKVKYCSGHYATSKSLQGTRYADSLGNYTWHWTPQTSCHGWATAYVTAKWKGQSISKSDTFTVK